MLKLSDLYNHTKYSSVPLENYIFRLNWFPELSFASYDISDETFEALNTEKRIEIRQIVSAPMSPDDAAELHTVWFDGKPVFVAQNGGPDTRNRFLTDAATYSQLVQHILSKVILDIDEEELSTEIEYFEEKLLYFGGHNFIKAAGFNEEPRSDDFQMFAHMAKSIEGADPDHYLVAATTRINEAPNYIRRFDFVMKFVRELSREELDANSRIETYMGEKGFDKFFWYVQCERPVGEPIVSM